MVNLESLSVNLYLDEETRKYFSSDPFDLSVSFSAYVRVMRRLFSQAAESDTLLIEIRERMKKIILEEKRRV